MSPNLDLLRQRADLLRRLRQFFDQRGFLEVQPPCLSRTFVVDPYIDPIEVESRHFQVAVDLPPRFFLQPSPEAAMKRMLAAGAPSIYGIVPAFRAGERGDHHNIEFTMLEWYEVDADLDAGIRTLGNLAIEVLDQPGYEVVAYRELFVDAIGLDPIDSDLLDLQRKVAEVTRGTISSVSDQRDTLLDILMSECVQPQIGHDRPVVVKNYPISQAALARAASDDPQCAARFELFFRGTELANGYDELRDPEIMIRRRNVSNRIREASGRAALDTDSELVSATRMGLPACSGVALGVDRLLMVRSGATSIDQTIPFPIEIA